jgi:hypothetical protein
MPENTPSLNPMPRHENRIGLPWVMVRQYKGSFSSLLAAALQHYDFDQYSHPTKDKTGHWLFSLKYLGSDVLMIRCWGSKAKDHALQVVNSVMDEAI